MADDSDPFAPTQDHAAELEDARRRAREDATRHAEDFLDRPLPIIAAAETLARRRIAVLEAARADRLGELECAVEDTRREAESAAARHAAVRQSLAAAGVPRDELDLPPFDAPMAAGWRIGAPLAAAGAGAAVALILGLRTTGVVVVAVVCAAIAYAGLVATEEPVVESARLRKLRKARLTVEAALLAAQHAHETARERLATLHEQVRALARAERALAEEMVATYVTELTSAMPPGALADGHRVAVQRAPRVDLPDWAQEPS